MLEETDHFQAQTADGVQTFTVVEWSKVFIDVSLDGKRNKRYGTREYRLDTGKELNPISDDEFDILPNGPRIYRIR
jgi:hypothetical protein